MENAKTKLLHFPFYKFSTGSVEKPVEKPFHSYLTVDFQMTFSTLHTFWANDYEIL